MLLLTCLHIPTRPSLHAAFLRATIPGGADSSLASNQLSQGVGIGNALVRSFFWPSLLGGGRMHCA